jgi:hypothetical protein
MYVDSHACLAILDVYVCLLIVHDGWKIRNHETINERSTTFIYSESVARGSRAIFLQ